MFLFSSLRDQNLSFNGAPWVLEQLGERQACFQEKYRWLVVKLRRFSELHWWRFVSGDMKIPSDVDSCCRRKKGKIKKDQVRN